MDVPEASARTIAESAADWVDAGVIPLPAGAEDAHYAQGEQGYRTGNTYFHDVSELRTVQGMTPDIYKRLRPWICALPVAGPSPINFNTLTPEQAPLVAMLAPERISLQVAAQAISERPPSGWESGPQFFLTPALKGVSAPLEAELQPQAATQWFSLDVTVEVNGAELEETALFDARTKPVKLVSRRWGESE
jgi:general secretion pathway protein K